MGLGRAPTQQCFQHPRQLLGDRLREGSLYRFLADHGEGVFPDDYFADLYTTSKRGRPTIPARVLATTMVLQAFEGLSDREACERMQVDLRWQAAAGVDTGYEGFHPTVLVGIRTRLRASSRPRRLFEDTTAMGRTTGAFKKRARVLDSTPLYDAVATQDSVTQIRGAIRRVLAVLGRDQGDLLPRVWEALQRNDDYQGPGKPPCDWDDPQAREALVDDLVHDALGVLSVLEGEVVSPQVGEASDLLALVAGQDTEEGQDGVFRIKRGVARDRVVSVVDPEARHGHKSNHRRFDGYKAHLCVDPDSELIEEVVATPANTADREATQALVADHVGDAQAPQVVGDAAYGDGATRAALAEQGFSVMAKCPPVRNATGGFPKDHFSIDTEAGRVTCPAGHTVPIRFTRGGGGKASFGAHCRACPLRGSCTKSTRGRSIGVHPHEGLLATARATQADPAWQEAYRATRPTVERKVAHLVRRSWGGRRARTRGLARVTTDLWTRAGAINWARLATLGLHHDGDTWVLGTT